MTYAERKERAAALIIKRGLAKHAGNRTKTARALGLNRTYLQRLIVKYGLKKESGNGQEDTDGFP